MYDDIVIGAGLPGLLAAWRLAEHGRAVGVFDRGTVAAGSSALAAGHIPQRAFDPTTLDILRRTRAVVEQLARRTGGAVVYRRLGGVLLAASSQGRDLFEQAQAQNRRWGAASEVLPPHEIAARWPEVCTDDLVAGLYCADDGFVRSLDLSVVLGAMARQAGAAIHEGCPVDRVDVSADGRVRGVVVAGERIPAASVVVAAGAWSDSLARASGIRLPLKPFVLGATILLGTPDGLPFLSDLEAGYYALPRNPRSLLLGLPPRVDDIRPDDFASTPDPDQQEHCLRLLRRRLPAAAPARVVGGWAGVLVATPDNFPLVGPHGVVQGLYLATGFAGGGLQWVAAAEALADAIADRAPPFDLGPFRADRFATYRGEAFSFRHGTPYFYQERAR